MNKSSWTPSNIWVQREGLQQGGTGQHRGSCESNSLCFRVTYNTQTCPGKHYKSEKTYDLCLASNPLPQACFVKLTQGQFRWPFVAREGGRENSWRGKYCEWSRKKRQRSHFVRQWESAPTHTNKKPSQQTATFSRENLQPFMELASTAGENACSMAWGVRGNPQMEGCM